MNESSKTLATERARYMAHEITHQAYYLWLSDFIGLTDSLIPASNERVKRSTDPHLNDISIHLWDSMHYTVQRIAFQKGLPWSMSDTVCCLKAMANRRAESAI